MFIAQSMMCSSPPSGELGRHENRIVTNSAWFPTSSARSGRITYQRRSESFRDRTSSYSYARAFDRQAVNRPARHASTIKPHAPPLGTPQEIIYPNCEVFCPASRRNDRRIVNYVTVIATQKLDKRQSKVGKLFPVGCLMCQPLKNDVGIEDGPYRHGISIPPAKKDLRCGRAIVPSTDSFSMGRGDIGAFGIFSFPRAAKECIARRATNFFLLCVSAVLYAAFITAETLKVIAGKEHTGLRSNFVQLRGAMTGV